MIMLSLKYLSNDFEKMIIQAIHDPSTDKFSICTAYTSKSMIEKMVSDTKFNAKLKYLLIGDPLSLGYSGDRERISKILEEGGKDRAFFADLGSTNTSSMTWRPIVHSKIYIGYNDINEPIWAFIGSPNFSENGMGRHHESLIQVTDINTLNKINDHIIYLKNLCVPNSLLTGLNRYKWKGKNGEYHFQLIDNMDPINNLEIILVAIKDKDEFDTVTASQGVRLDCLKVKSSLFKALDGKGDRNFVFIFSDRVDAIENARFNVVKFGVSAATVSPQRTEDHQPSANTGYIRFHDEETLVDWDPNPPPSGSVKHQRTIPFVSPKLEHMRSKKKWKILDFIEKLQQSDSGENLKSILNGVSDEDGEEFLESPQYIEDAKGKLLELSKLQIGYKKPPTVSEKMGYKGNKEFNIELIHSDEKYAMSNPILGQFESGQSELKKDFPMKSHITPTRFLRSYENQ